MRFINLIVVHCSATRCDRSYTEHDLTTCLLYTSPSPRDCS